MVDELSNLKKHRVSGFNSACRDVVFLCVLNYVFTPLKTESLYPAEEQQHLLPGRQS